MSAVCSFFLLTRSVCVWGLSWLVHSFPFQETFWLFPDFNNYAAFMSIHSLWTYISFSPGKVPVNHKQVVLPWIFIRKYKMVLQSDCSHLHLVIHLFYTQIDLGYWESFLAFVALVDMSSFLLSFVKKDFFLLYVCGYLPVCMSMHSVHSLPTETRKSIGSSGIWATDGCWPCGFLDIHLGPL